MKLRKGFWIYFPVALLAWIAPVNISTANADSFTTTGANDYFFTLEQSQLFTVRTYAQQYGIDSMLWLYDQNNTILAANDDSQFGLDSYISMNLNPGTYRLRTGVCCGDPNRWYGNSYVIDVNIAPSNAPSTTTTTTTSTTTSTTSTTTTTVPPTTTTTVEPYYNAVKNLTAVANENGSVTLDWGAPDTSNIEPYIYTITWFDLNEGVESGGWGVWTRAENTTYTVGEYQFPNTSGYGPVRFKVSAGNASCVGEGNGSCIYGSHASVDVTVNAPVSTTTTTTTTIPQTTTTSSVPQTTLPESTTTTTLPPETSTSTTEPQTTTTSSTSTTVPQTSTTSTVTPTSTTTTSTLPPVYEPPVEVPTGTTSTTVEETTTTTTLPEETTTTTEPEPVTTVPETTTEPSPQTTVEETTTTTIPDSIITPEEVAAVVEELTTITEVTPEVLSQVVDALNSDNITEEQVQAIVDAVVENLDTLTEITPEVLNEVLNVLESDNITQEQVQEVVDTILATDISSDQATQLATSAAVLESITGDQATEVFASIDTGELSGEEAAAIVEALLEAPTEVKEAFEAEINVFEGGFDNYIPTDSVISVGARRVVVAATTVSFILPAPVVSRRQSRV